MPHLEEILRHAKETCEGRYRAEIQALLGLSITEISLIRHRPTDAETYEALTAELMEASRQNLSEQVLKARIEALGPDAVDIAKRVPGLARILIPSRGDQSCPEGSQ